MTAIPTPMTVPSPQPALAWVVCPWSPSAQPGALQRWRDALPAGGDWMAPAEGPLAALRGAVARWPGRPLLLACLDATPPPWLVERLLAAAERCPEADVISPLGSAQAALDPFDGAAPADADRRCWRRGGRGLYATRHWLPTLGLWRPGAALALPDVAGPELPPALRGMVAPMLYLDGGPVAAAGRGGALLDMLRAALAAPARAGWPGLDGRPVVLHVAHGWGGGADRFLRDLADADQTRHHLVLRAESDPARALHGVAMALHDDLDATPLARWPLASPIAHTAIASPEVAAILAEVREAFGIGAIAVSSVIGHALDVLRTGLPTAVCTHDFYPLWPRLDADFGDAGADFSEAALAACLADPAPLLFAEREPQAWRTLRRAWLEALEAADATMVHPGDGVRDAQRRIAPALARRRWVRVPHGDRPLPPPHRADVPCADVQRDAAPDADDAPLRVLVPGRLAGGKGEHLVDGLLSAPLPGVELYLVGSGAVGQRWFGRNGVHVQLDYARDALPGLVASLRPHLALLPSTVSETWGYVLGEMRQLGVPVLATARGSYLERIRDGVDGLLVDADPEALRAMLLRLRDARGALPALAASAPPAVEPAAMAAGWAEALPARAPEPPPLAPAGPAEVEAALLRGGLADMRARLEAGVAAAAERERELDRRAAWASELESQRDAARQAQAEALADAGARAAEAAALRAAGDAVRAENQALRAECETLRDGTDRLQAQVDALRAEADRLRADAGAARAEAASSREAHAQARAELDAAAAALAGFARREATLSQALDASLAAAIDAAARDAEAALADAHRYYARDTADLVAQRDIAIAQRDELQAAMGALLRSRSWRLTRPLRGLLRALRRRLAGLRYRVLHARNLLRRGLASLRGRGVAGTLAVLRARRGAASPAAHEAPAAAPVDASDATPPPTALPCHAAPKASIIIPVYGKLPYTLACLRSLQDAGDATPLEVIVVDDASPDRSADALAGLPGLRLLRNPRNLGFIGACNAGAEAARGEFLVFLNNDTTVRPGWLDALLATFEEHPRTGLAGSRLVYPDGRLQEAGGIVFADGSGWNWGRFDDPADPRYGHAREVDYCSGAAIAIPAALFRALGGFDRRYAPAYYEDTDLAMQVRARGLRVMVNPTSEVVHHEGVTSGTDTGSGVKAYQVRNQQVFFERWKHVLARDHLAPGTPAALACTRGVRRRVLVIDAETPRPDHDSGSLRMVNLMRVLREEGCAVSFLPDNHAHAGRYTRDLQAMGVECWHQPFIGGLPRWFAEHGARFDVVIASRHYVAEAVAPLVRAHAPQARLVFDTVDLHYLRERREAELAGHDPARLRAAERTRAAELALVRGCDATLVVSPVEQALLAGEVPGARVEVVSNVHRVAGPGLPFAQRADLLFVGGYRHPPNVDAALWMVGEVLPRVLARLPGVRLHLVGSAAPPEVVALGEREGVVFHGFVEDIAPLMDGMRLGVAPLRYGAGVKGKVNLALAHGQPMVATRCAVEGMHLLDGHDVLVADDAAGFADAIVRAYTDAALWKRLAANGLDNIERHFSFDAARRALRPLLD